MLQQREAGFTLIEIVLVTAVASLLAIIVFVGQRTLRSRAMFDASINKIEASIADARNEALAGINSEVSTAGGGTGQNGCAGGGITTFAGVAWLAPAGGSIAINYYKTDGTPAKTCPFDVTRTVNFQSPITITTAGAILFARTSTGGLTVCRYGAIPDPGQRTQTFATGKCDPGASLVGVWTNPLNMAFGDADGHASSVQVDSSGLAKRLN